MFEWSQNCENAFHKIKEYLISPPILAIFDHYAITNIYTDASIDGMGTVLKQIQTGGTEKPVAYFSRKFTESQRKKKAIYLECIAIKEAIKFWQYWLLVNIFYLTTFSKKTIFSKI